MRLINADKVKAESREHCKTCILNGTKQCDKTCVINLICDRLDLQPTVEVTTTVKGDLISRDALKTAIEDRIDNIPASEYDNGWNNAIYAVIDEIDNAPTVETSKVEHKAYNEGYKDGVEQGIKLSERLADNWIPVSERLPDLWEVVLVTDETGNAFEYERRITDEDGNVCEEWSFLGRKIIAWMPLPEPYKKGGAE